MSTKGIADTIRPYIPLELRDIQFIGVYVNNNSRVCHELKSLFVCKVSYLNPIRDITNMGRFKRKREAGAG
jgi:hypothetical protein